LRAGCVPDKPLEGHGRATFDPGVEVGSAVPAKSLKELVDWLKASPDKASYGTPAAGSLPHFFALL